MFFACLIIFFCKYKKIKFDYERIRASNSNNVSRVEENGYAENDGSQLEIVN
jgi:hypothetical protein